MMAISCLIMAILLACHLFCDRILEKKPKFYEVGQDIDYYAQMFFKKIDDILDYIKVAEIIVFILIVFCGFLEF